MQASARNPSFHDGDAEGCRHGLKRSPCWGTAGTESRGSAERRMAATATQRNNIIRGAPVPSDARHFVSRLVSLLWNP